MMAMLFAQRVIQGKTRFEDVPAKLKSQTAQLLAEIRGRPAPALPDGPSL